MYLNISYVPMPACPPTSNQTCGHASQKVALTLISIEHSKISVMVNHFDAHTVDSLQNF